MAIFNKKPDNQNDILGESYTLEDKTKPVFPCLEIQEFEKFSSYGYNLTYSTINDNDSQLFVQKRIYKNGQTFLDIGLLNDETKEFKYVTVKNINTIKDDDGTNLMEIEYYIDSSKDLKQTAKCFLPYKFSPTAEDPVDHLSVELNKLQRNFEIEPSNVYKNKLEFGRLKPTVFQTVEQAKSFMTFQPKNYWTKGYTPESKMVYVPYKNNSNETNFMRFELNNSGKVDLLLNVNENVIINVSPTEFVVDAKTGKIAMKTNLSHDNKFDILPIDAKNNPELVGTLQSIANGKVTTANLDGFELLPSRFVENVANHAVFKREKITENQLIVKEVDRNGFVAENGGNPMQPTNQTAGNANPASQQTAPQPQTTPVAPANPQPTTENESTQPEKPKGTVIGEQSKVSYNGNSGINAPKINELDNSISMDISISGGHFQNGATQKIKLTDEKVSSDYIGRTLLSIYKQDSNNSSKNITFASVTKNGTNYQLHIDKESLQACLNNYEIRTGKKFPLTGNIFNPQTIKMSDSNELQGAEINIGDGKTVSISFDAAGMKIVSTEKLFNEDGSPKLDEKGKQQTHEEIAFLSSGSRPLDFSVNPQFLHEAATVNPVVDNEGNLIDPPLPSVKIEGHIAENLMVMSILQERQKSEKADENKKSAIITRTFGDNNEIQINSVPVYEEGLAEPYYFNIIREKNKSPRIFLDMRAPKQGQKQGAELAPKFYEIKEIGIEAKSVDGAKNANEKGKAEGFGLYLGIKSDNNKVRLNLPNLAYESFAKNGIIDFLDNIHEGNDGYVGFPFNELKSNIIGYRQKGTGTYFSTLPKPLPAGTTVKDFMEIHSRSKTNTNTIKGTNTIANLRNNISDIVEEEIEEVKDFLYQPKISYDTRKGQRLEFDKNGTTSIALPMDKKFNFEENAAQTITLINDKEINAGINDTYPANPSEEKIISVADPKIGGETISFTRTVNNGETSFSMNFDAKLLQQMVQDYKTLNNQDFDLDLSKLTAEDGKIKFDVDKILISDDLKIQGVEIKAAGKTLAIDITAAGYMISNGKQVARHRMEKQPLDFTFNSSILNDAETNTNFELKDGKIKDELQVMAIQQARFKASQMATNEPVILNYGENLTLYSLPVNVGGSIQNFVFRQEKGKTPELYADLESPKGAAKLAPKFSKITHLNMEAMFDEAGNVISSGLYLGERKNQNNSESIRIEVGNVDLTDKTSQNLLTVLEQIQDNSKGNFHLNEFISSNDKQQVAIQGYRQIDTNPETGEKTINIVKNIQEEDGDPEKPKTAGREYQPVYSIGGEKSYHINWDNVAKLQNNAQKEIVEKEKPVEKKEPVYDMPKVPKRKKKKVNEYISTLGLIGLGVLAAILGIINPFFLIVSSALFATVVLKDTGLLGAIVEAFGPRDEDALDIHNNIVKTRSKIVETDKSISDVQAKIDEILQRAGKVDAKSGKINCNKLLGINGNSVNIIDANGTPVDLKDINFDASGNPIDKNGNPLQIKDKCGFTSKQIQDIVKIQQDLIAKQEEIKLQNDAKKQAKLKEDAQLLEEEQRKIFDQNFNDIQELEKRKKQLENKIKKQRNKASSLIETGEVLYNNGTPYDLDLRNEYTDEQGNQHTGTEAYYNQNNKEKYDAAVLANKNYKGNASNVTVKSEGPSK